MFFIHTFSLVKNLHIEDAERLWHNYQMIKIKENNKEIMRVNEFAKKGLRIDLSYRANEAKHYDKEHREIKAEIIVTPFKLLYEGKSVGYFKSIEDYKEALEVFEMLLDDINDDVGIDFFDAELTRIDLTKDIITPSQVYTREIISVMKAVRLPRGYQPYEWKNTNYDWNKRDGFLYQNKGLGIKIKLYDKEQNLVKYGEDISFLKGKGILRFEVALEKRYLKGSGYMRKTIYGTMQEVLRNADWIYLENIIEPLDFGDIFSKELLERYIDRKYPSKYKRTEKMKFVVKKSIEAKKFDCMLENNFLKNYDATCRVLKRFEELDICPIPAISECPYIPSISKLLKGCINEMKYDFAKEHTRGKELWCYGS